MRKVLPVWQIATQAFANLKANDPIRMAGATAFFSFFALPPIIILLSQLLSRLFNNRYQQVSSQLFAKLGDLFGAPGAHQLQDIAQNLQKPRDNDFLSWLSVLILLLASTTLFTIIKNSLNQLWNVKASADHKFRHVLLDKVIALGLIGLSGFLFALALALGQTLGSFVSTNWVVTLAHHARSLAVLTIWIALVFKYLPDIRIRWSAVWLGALVTSILIELGEALLDRFLINSSVGSMYGASGAIILILLFNFYASLIFYYGASFTRQCTQRLHQEAEPGTNAVAYQIKEIEP